MLFVGIFKLPLSLCLWGNLLICFYYLLRVAGFGFSDVPVAPKGRFQAKLSHLPTQGGSWGVPGEQTPQAACYRDIYQNYRAFPQNHWIPESLGKSEAAIFTLKQL